MNVSNLDYCYSCLTLQIFTLLGMLLCASDKSDGKVSEQME